MNNSAARYKSKLKRKLQCSRGTKTRLVEEFCNSLNVFLDENPDASFTDLSKAFGPPEEMAKILMDQVDEQEKRTYKLHQLFLRIVAVILAIVLLIVSANIFFWKEKPVDVDSGVIVDETFYIPDDSIGGE